jgi:hypothetical protein
MVDGLGVVEKINVFASAGSGSPVRTALISVTIPTTPSDYRRFKYEA